MRYVPIVLASGALLAAAACDDDATRPEIPGEPAGLTLSVDALTLTARGQVAQLAATVSDANGLVLGDVSVSWSSGDEAVATVDGTGRVEAIGSGQTEVTATAGGATAVATVVVSLEVASVAISPALVTLRALDDSVRYSATVRDANGHVIPDAVVTWTSGDTTIAAIDQAGWATARANGTAVVTAMAGDAVDEAGIVVDQTVASVTVTPAVDTLGQGETMQLGATAEDANGFAVQGAAVVWTTSDPGVALVDAAGRVTGAGWGADATITATVAGMSASANVHLLDQIAIGSNDDGNAEIYLMNPDGTGLTNLTADPAADDRPTWSPDGTRIAFVSERDGGAQIYVMDAGGSNQTNLTNTDGFERSPAWSPDGARIAFRSQRDGNLEIYVMNADGSGQTRLTDDPGIDAAPAWSPDGTRIAFASNRSGGSPLDFEIWVMDDDGSHLVQLTNDSVEDAGPRWTPDGRILYFKNMEGRLWIYIMDADGSNQRPLSPAGIDGTWVDWRPVP